MKASMIAWIVVLASFFAVTIVYIIGYDVIVNTFIPLAQTDYGITSNTFDFITAMWDAFPYVLLIGGVIYGLGQSQKREYETGYT